MDNLNLLTNANVAEDGEKGEDGRESDVAVDDEERHIIHFEAVGEVADAGAVVIGVGDDDDLVPAVDELARDLVDVRLSPSRLREEEVADHGDVVLAAGHGARLVCGIGKNYHAMSPVSSCAAILTRFISRCSLSCRW